MVLTVAVYYVASVLLTTMISSVWKFCRTAYDVRNFVYQCAVNSCSLSMSGTTLIPEDGLDNRPVPGFL